MQIKGNLLTLVGITRKRVVSQQFKARGSILFISVSPAVNKQPELSRNSVISICVKIRWEIVRSEGPISPNPFLPPYIEVDFLVALPVHLDQNHYF